MLPSSFRFFVAWLQMVCMYAVQVSPMYCFEMKYPSIYSNRGFYRDVIDGDADLGIGSRKDYM